MHQNNVTARLKDIWRRKHFPWGQTVKHMWSTAISDSPTWPLRLTSRCWVWWLAERRNNIWTDLHQRIMTGTSEPDSRSQSPRFESRSEKWVSHVYSPLKKLQSWSQLRRIMNVETVVAPEHEAQCRNEGGDILAVKHILQWPVHEKSSKVTFDLRADPVELTRSKQIKNQYLYRQLVKKPQKS